VRQRPETLEISLLHSLPVAFIARMGLDLHQALPELTRE